MQADPGRCRRKAIGGVGGRDSTNAGIRRQPEKSNGGLVGGVVSWDGVVVSTLLDEGAAVVVVVVEGDPEAAHWGYSTRTCC